MRRSSLLAMILLIKGLTNKSNAFSSIGLRRPTRFSTAVLYRENSLEKTNPFRVTAEYEPAGDQPLAIDTVEKQLNSNKMSILQGATGTGKTFVMAHLIERRNQPCLVLAHNKLLAAQLARELKSFLKPNSVELFVSYYNHYVPESFKESTNTYVGKKSAISAEIDALRHCATRSLLTRNDVVVVSSVSCIFGIGMPSEYLDSSLRVSVHSVFKDKDSLVSQIQTQMLYDEATEDEFTRGQFQNLDDGIMLWPPHDALPIHISLEVTKPGKTVRVTSITQGTSKTMPNAHIFPAKHHVISPERLEDACQRIQEELDERRQQLIGEQKIEQAERLSQRVVNDLFMLRETGTCSGIENYSRHVAGKAAGLPPTTLLDYFNRNDWWLVMDESHVTMPQLSAMYNGDQKRKSALVKHGYRLPSALDNRPLAFEEFWSKVDTTLFVSATPGNTERHWCPNQPVEMAIRPTFVPDPVITVQPKKDQLVQLADTIRQNKSGRTLALVLTKVDAEDLSAHLNKKGIRADFLHSGLTTHERSDALKKLQSGKIDCLVGVNCLREGLDLPQVSIVAVIDADVQGFLRSETALLQMIGRAARNVDGKAIFYADRVSPAMKACMEATERRRTRQLEYNDKHGVAMRSTKGSSVLSIFDLAQEQIQQELENNSLRKVPRSITTAKDTSGKIATEHIPSSPGVYMWKDNKGKILYIGKAIKLRSRIRSYQATPKDKHSKRIQIMVERASSVDFILTPSERDALVLESNMIKYHQPPFNVLLKDDEHYPFLHATSDDIPKLLIAPRKANDSNGRFFGPYTNFKEIHSILDGIEETYDLRGQAFLARHGSLPKETYRTLFDKVIEEVFDRGADTSSLAKRREEYEEAGLLFDSEYNRNRDVVAVAPVKGPRRKHKVIVHILQLREGVVAGQFSYTCQLSRVDEELDVTDYSEAIQTVLLSKHYPAGESNTQSDHVAWVPDNILVPVALSKQNSMQAYLGKPVSIKTAAKSGPRKAVDARVVEFATQNVEEAAAAELRKENDLTSSNDVGKLLDLAQPLRRIECYVSPCCHCMMMWNRPFFSQPNRTLAICMESTQLRLVLSS